MAGRADSRATHWRPRRMLPRRAFALGAVALMLLVPFGCERAHPTPSVITKLEIDPAPDCPTADNGQPLYDTADGFKLMMPGNWRNLRPGDPGWLTLYGEGGANSDTEQAIVNGELQDFAVPLAPQDEDKLATLAVYVDHVDKPDLQKEGLDYANVIKAHDGTATSQDLIVLPAGDAVRVVGHYPYGHGWDFDMWIVSYTIYHDGARYMLVLVSRMLYSATYQPVAQCMATSLEFTGPAPTLPPTASPQDTAAPS